MEFLLVIETNKTGNVIFCITIAQNLAVFFQPQLKIQQKVTDCI